MPIKRWTALFALTLLLALLAPACRPGLEAAPISTGPAAPGPSVDANPFGVLIWPQLSRSAQGVQTAKQLGVTYLRPSQAIAIDQWDGTCSPCEAAQQSGLKLVLTVKNTGGLSASRPPEDLDAYKDTLGEILDRYPPELLVVENEENSSIFYSGSPADYGEELKAACEIAHARGIKCANGGLVNTLVALLVWDGYRAEGSFAAAEDFAGRAFEPGQQNLLDSPQAQEQLAKGKALLEVYRTAGMDYVNFHWYISDPQALGEAVAFLQLQTGLPVISNEVGQFNEDADQTRAVLSKLGELDLPIVVWFGMDGPKARGLVEKDGTLRPTGEAFRQFILANYRQ